MKLHLFMSIDPLKLNAAIIFKHYPIRNDCVLSLKRKGYPLSTIFRPMWSLQLGSKAVGTGKGKKLNGNLPSARRMPGMRGLLTTPPASCGMDSGGLVFISVLEGRIPRLNELSQLRGGVRIRGDNG